METRTVTQLFEGRPTREGAGVNLHRIFGHGHERIFDPFLLFDSFGSDDSADYGAGFPWHPHRGIETITYILAGEVEHQDSLGNCGTIGPGDLQWMTAGSGIIHQETPKVDAEGRMKGLQLWANLPSDKKMIAPSYQEVRSADIPQIDLENGARVKVISGHVGSAKGPITGIATDPEYLDVSIEAGGAFAHSLHPEHTAFAYVLEGIIDSGDSRVRTGQLAVLSPGARIAFDAPAGARFLVISGRALHEPIAWRGPIVMNSAEDVALAYSEYHIGNFIKHAFTPCRRFLR